MTLRSPSISSSDIGEEMLEGPPQQRLVKADDSRDRAAGSLASGQQGVLPRLRRRVEAQGSGRDLQHNPTSLPCLRSRPGRRPTRAAPCRLAPRIAGSAFLATAKSIVPPLSDFVEESAAAASNQHRAIGRSSAAPRSGPTCGRRDLVLRFAAFARLGAASRRSRRGRSRRPWPRSVGRSAG